MMLSNSKETSFSFAKIIACVFAVLCAALIAVGVQAGTAEKAYAADDNEQYTYTVTLYAGDGTIEGKAEKVYSNIPINGTCTISWQNLDIRPANNKYYVKGIRLVGDDKLFASGCIPEKGKDMQDMQLVVAYGLKKGQVAYTINYVDENGRAIADSQTLNGNVGDKPVIAYQYIEGYQPTNAYNLTGTLEGNAEDNVFTFKYRAVQGSSAGTTNGGASAGTTGGQATPGDENATTGENAAGDEATGDEAADETGTQEGAANGAEPAELLDIDDDSNPLASAQSAVQETFSNPLNYLPWVLGVLVVIALISVIALMVAKKRAGKDAS
ncbi:uncharacterized protein BN592_00869 [Eggerthella sp. CAG:298]|nr:uncharacterized protein BN592_00869 [Eggerthella sp. CAG:298]